LTGVGNDYAFNQIFSRQVDALAKEGDVFIGISTSGNSDNVIEAVKIAEEKKVTTIGFLGKDGGKLKDICDKSLIVPCDTTARVQEAHELSYHIICEIVDEKLAE
ncbi:MAG: SIS domain-containing protein, partial [Lachnospiraceae bacterium]|nr:SIS domain-containing protein [Lachnospiraceae bacterium]